LFLYETYNQLINQRNESDKDKEIAKQYGLKLKNSSQNKNFKGLLQRFKSDSNFIFLKLSENDNNDGKTSSEVTGNFSTPYPHLDSLKEFDLLLLSNQELET
jgi:predicted DNA binding CopG/RHH family protein